MTPHTSLRAGAFLFVFLWQAPSFAQPAPWQVLLGKAERSERQFEYEQAEKYLSSALEEARQAQAGVEDITNILDRLGDSKLRFSPRLFRKPEDHYQEALDLRMEYFGPDHDSVGVSLQRLGKLALGRRHYDEAHDYLRRALAIQRNALGEVHVDVVNLYIDIGEVYLGEKREKEAQDSFERALKLRQQSVGETGEEVAETLDEIAKRHAFRFPKWEEEYLERALRYREKNLAEDGPRLLTALLSLAKHYRQRAWYEKAETSLARAQEIAQRHFAPDSFEAALVHAAHGSVHFDRNQLEAAEESYRRAVEIGETRAAVRENLAANLESLARVLEAQKRVDEACALYQRSMDTLIATKPLYDADLPPALFRLAQAHRQHRDFEKADQTYRMLYTIQANEDGPRSLPVAHVLEEAGDMNVVWKQWQGAVPHYETMVAIREKEWEPEHPRLAGTLSKLARVYRELGRHEEARQIEQRASRAGRRLMASVFQEIGGNLLAFRVAGWPAWKLLGASFSFGVAVLTWFLLAGRKKPTAELTGPGGIEYGFSPPAEESPAIDSVSAPYYRPQEGQDLTTLGLQPGPLPADADPVSPPAARREFSFLAEGGDLFSIWIMNLLRTLLTLGVYYFWAKIRVRRYVYEHTFFDGDPLAFHGTGKEMLLGWLKALPFLAVILWGPTFLPLIWPSPYAEAVAIVVAVVAALVLWPLAQIGARRYRLSRSSWRGIRFSFRGTRSRYFGIFMAGSFLGLFTLGLSSPFFSVWEHRFFVTNSHLGNQRFGFRGRDGDLLVQFLLAALLTPLTLGLYWFWYQAYRERYLWSNTTFGSATFRCTLSGKQLFRLTMGNFFLIVFTLGFGWPWALVRRARVWLENIRLEGPVDFSSIRQDVLEGDAAAEGFADYLGMDFGI